MKDLVCTIKQFNDIWERINPKEGVLMTAESYVATKLEGMDVTFLGGSLEAGPSSGGEPAGRRGKQVGL